MGARYTIATLLRHARLLTPFDEIEDAAVLLDGGRVVAFGASIEAERADVVDLTGLILAPGFIDIHVHGGGGASLAGSSHRQLDAYKRWAPRFGVTGFLAGTLGATPERITQALRHGAEHAESDGATLLGFHLEGPFISRRRCGAFHPDWLVEPSEATFSSFVEAANGRLTLMTLAPELAGALPVVREAIRSGVRPSLGHTDASYEQMLAGFDAGARNVTHCFNAMRPFGHRDPGPIAAALSAPGVFCELIADGVHVSEGAMRLMLAARGTEQTVLVTDGIQLAGLQSGSFGLAGHEVRVEAGRATTENGTLAGSAATMDQCVRNAVRLGGVTIRAAIQMAGFNPARAIGLDGERGSIAPGRPADLVALDRDLNVVATWIRGRLVFDALPGGTWSP